MLKSISIKIEVIIILPLERRKRIFELLQTQKNIKISDLSSELNVSEMTIHRDIKPMIKDQLLFKTFGGICLNESNDSSKSEYHIQNICVICNQVVNERLCYRLILSNGSIEQTCCSHCGLIRHQQEKDNVIQAIAPDFLKHTTVSTEAMYYVFDTTLDIGCCYPQVLPFESFHHANQFISGFGGKIHSFSEAIKQICSPIPTKNCCTKKEQHD